jgi:hypothetical protein
VLLVDIAEDADVLLGDRGEVGRALAGDTDHQQPGRLGWVAGLATWPSRSASRPTERRSRSSRREERTTRRRHDRIIGAAATRCQPAIRRARARRTTGAPELPPDADLPRVHAPLGETPPTSYPATPGAVATGARNGR